MDTPNGNQHPLSPDDSKVVVTGAKARHYDVLMNLITAGTYPLFIRRVMRDMAIQPEDRILDQCTVLQAMVPPHRTRPANRRGPGHDRQPQGKDAISFARVCKLLVAYGIEYGPQLALGCWCR